MSPSRRTTSASPSSKCRNSAASVCPVVTFDAGYIDQKSAFPASRYGYGAFRFSVPIWQSNQVDLRVATAKEREEQAKLLLEDAKIAAHEDVRKAITDLHAAETTLQLAKEQLAAAEAEYAQVVRAVSGAGIDLARSRHVGGFARRCAPRRRFRNVESRPRTTPRLVCRRRDQRSRWTWEQPSDDAFSHHTISILILAILPFGCEKKDAADRDDDAGRAGAAGRCAECRLGGNGDDRNDNAGEPAGAAPSASRHPNQDGTIVATGELISPVRSELAVKIPGRVGEDVRR